MIKALVRTLLNSWHCIWLLTLAPPEITPEHRTKTQPWELPLWPRSLSPPFLGLGFPYQGGGGIDSKYRFSSGFVSSGYSNCTAAQTISDERKSELSFITFHLYRLKPKVNKTSGKQRVRADSKAQKMQGDRRTWRVCKDEERAHASMKNKPHIL